MRAEDPEKTHRRDAGGGNRGAIGLSTLYGSPLLRGDRLVVLLQPFNSGRAYKKSLSMNYPGDGALSQVPSAAVAEGRSQNI